MIVDALLWWLVIAVLLVAAVSGYVVWLWFETTHHGDEWGES